MTPHRLLAGVTVLAGIIARGPDSDLAPQLRALLSEDLKFSAADLADLEHEKIVRHGLDATARGEVAAVGAVRIKARKEAFVDAFRNIVRFKRGAEVLEIGRFSDPPAMSDFAGLTVDRQDVDLRDCRVHDCDIRLSAEVIDRVQHEVDWRARDADARAAAFFKQVLLDHVRAYTKGGPGRITEYDDDKRPVTPPVDFNGILRAAPYVGTLVPGLDEHLRDFPDRPLEGAEDFVYWSKEKFGIAPFITVTHVTITRNMAGDYVITSKDVYSSRYFDASLTVTIASDARSGPEAFYLVYVNRSRASALKGSFAGVRRAIVERRARATLDQNLRNLKLRFEKGL